MATQKASEIYTIPAGVPFADALAQGILSQFVGSDPITLSTLTILLPTRRAVRAVREAFLRVSGGTAMLLPQLRALGDADAEELAFGTEGGGEIGGADALDLPPPIAPLRRQFLLMQLINGWGRARDAHYPPAATARLAAELARFLDQIESEQLAEGLRQTALAALVPDGFAAHWQETLEFLKIITTAWPEILREEAAMDPAAHRNAMLHALSTRWLANPPPGRVIAAGSTGSVPATAELLEIISRMPQGMLILPGLDQTLDAQSWLCLDPGHPQYGLARLLARLGVEREAVRVWPGHSFTANPARLALLSEALRPAETTDAWRDAAQRLQPQLSVALQGLSRIEAPAPREEAASIALAMREVLETPGKTAALVTPDRGLARRVAVELGRWGIEADDSAGVPLAQTSVMVFIRALAAMAGDEFAPVPLLAANKHPLAAAGMSPAEWRRMTRDFERRALRGPRPAPGIAGLSAAIENQPAHAFVERLAQCAAALIKCMELDNCLFTDYIDGLLETAENLAATADESGAARLWRSDDGDAAARFFVDLREHAELCETRTPTAFPALLDALLEGQAVRPRYGQHPRLFIWGPLEARLQHADRIILGGLNEGVWPATANVDPWLSRPMRQKFGLPAPERRIGLAAHDFVQAASGPDVILTRSRKRDGAPAAPSRWWLRIENLLAGLDARAALDGDDPWTDWAAALDMPDLVTPQPALRPRPQPPVAYRPRSLSVSDIAVLIRDPYAVYARHVLGLRALDPLDTEIGAAERGAVIHEILEKFVRAHQGPLTLDDLTSLRIIGRQHFDKLLSRPGVRAFWKPRFDDISDWFLNWDMQNRQNGVLPVGLEVKGAREFMAPAGPFRVRAIADRIDRTADGKLAIYDYKTGYNPNEKQIKAGFAPQLPLEGAIAQGGGFAGIAAGEIAKLALLRIRGIEPAGKEDLISTETIEEAWEGLQKLIEGFDDPSTAYVSRRAPMFMRDNGDYDHLARVREWSGADSGEEE